MCVPKVMQSDFISIMSLLGVVLIWEQFCHDIYGPNCYLYNAGLLCTRECVSLVQITHQQLHTSQPVVKPIKQDALTKASYITAILNICNFETIFTQSVKAKLLGPLAERRQLKAQCVCCSLVLSREGKKKRLKIQAR